MTVKSVGDLIKKVQTEILDPLISLLFVLATVIFIWGVIQYVIGGNSDEKTKNAKQVMLYGIIGMTVMASAWGIVKLLCDFFTTCPQLPF